MADEPHIRAPGGANLVMRVFDLFITLINAIGTFWIFVIMILINTDVFMRFLFNAPVRGVPLIISLSIIAIVFLQLADALKHGRFTRSDVMIGRLLAYRPITGHTLQMLYNLAGIALMGILFVYSVPFFEKTLENKTYAGNEGDFTLLDWPFKLMILIGAGACCIQYARHFWRDIRYLRGDIDVVAEESEGGTFQ